MFGCEHGHLVRVCLVDCAALVIVDDGLHGLLVILPTVIAVDRVTLDVHDARTLAQFSTDLKPLLNLIFIETGCSILRMHFRQAAAFGSRL